ncbi:hypothetical protein SARC_11811 [Sphaeroforma arctica JP610]|uniref:PROP1-like PPR domain-containing protein n=1 Tax=Sphaeroforma arctica JP610 TaxID=667725 RepID=A0A0L0FGT7_9EUKA|nr:hypothetical protein SARC_11811 [Sphaeroforma arctica JP610]KNC75671.1 hypothetical protein SARC_11811 [Sphaeroforma arctica JP610]|eukprot:XP_014149573.1 hypothetical protein SARC_11811 [Sphaeroforma arctica JP610]
MAMAATISRLSYSKSWNRCPRCLLQALPMLKDGSKYRKSTQFTLTTNVVAHNPIMNCRRYVSNMNRERRAFWALDSKSRTNDVQHSPGGGARIAPIELSGIVKVKGQQSTHQSRSSATSRSCQDADSGVPVKCTLGPKHNISVVDAPVSVKKMISVKKMAMATKSTGNYRKAALKVDSLVANRSLHSSDAYYAIIIYKQSRQPEKCVQVLEYIQEKGEKLTAYHYALCIAALSTHNKYSKAYALFEDMQTRGVVLDVATYTTVVQMLLKARELDAASEIVYKMATDGCKPNARTYTVLMAAFSRAGRWDDALRFFGEMESKCVTRDAIAYSSAISACHKGGHWERAIVFFDEMGRKGFKRDMTTYSAAISACGKGHNWRKAIELFDEMRKNGIRPNMIAYSAAISACEKGYQWTKALKLLDEMTRKGVKQDTIVYSAAISACDKGRQWGKAIELFDEMGAKGIKRNTIAYTVAITACNHANRWEKAVEIFADMDINGIVRDTAAYNAAISAFGKGRQWEKAIMLYNEMDSKGLQPDTKTYGAAISACERGQQWQKALALYHEMSANSVERDLVIYRVVIRALASGANAHGLIDSVYEDLIVNFTAYGRFWSRFEREGVLDLHTHTQLEAQSAVRRLLTLLQHRCKDGSPADVTSIIVGQGKNSVREPVLLATVQRQLKNLTPSIASHPMEANTGRLVVDRSDLVAWLKQNASEDFAPATGF